jgi:hypothetical protein
MLYTHKIYPAFSIALDPFGALDKILAKKRLRLYILRKTKDLAKPNCGVDKFSGD